MTKMAAMPIYSKNLKKSSSPEPIGDNLGTWYAASVLEYYQIWSNDDRGLILTYFYDKVKFGPFCFVWEKDKTKEFSETIVVYDIKVGWCN